MALPNNFNSWEWTQKLIRIGHNRSVKKHFKDVLPDDGITTGREALKTGLLIRDTDSALEVANKQIYFTRISKGEIPIASVPEDWPKRVGSDRPQLAIAFRPVGKKTTYTLVIPHYNGRKQPQIPAYRKGSYRGVLELLDGSKLIVNAATEPEAARVIQVLRRFIVSRHEIGVKARIAKVRGSDFTEARVVPIFADYYPHGMKNEGEVEWRHYF